MSTAQPVRSLESQLINLDRCTLFNKWSTC